MNNSSLPLVLVSHTLPDGWLDLLENHCRMVIGPVDANELSAKLENLLPDAEG